jgi:hypothetical protein
MGRVRIGKSSGCGNPCKRLGWRERDVGPHNSSCVSVAKATGPGPNVSKHFAPDYARHFSAGSVSPIALNRSLSQP